MARNLKVAVILFVPFFVLLAACKKSTNDKSKSALLAQGTWKFDNAKVGGLDVSGLLDACDKDNTVIFSSVTGTGTADEGPTKCDPSDPQSFGFSWSLTTNETVLYVTTPLFPGGSNNFTILSLTETEFVVSQDIDFSGTTQNTVITFKH